ncbi:NosL [Pannonibacter phragmitetus]|uniref:NosL n=1 Tax=Pannonibacter phragmitetus TaxID=121719 RepID=A0A378ZZT9_9HYPH|nr:nitrous oxide reductase accessory protein NosL [Pannonibacter phragmitetus]SUB02350.1 NosL [Pannonibacter phragmitetus]
MTRQTCSRPRLQFALLPLALLLAACQPEAATQRPEPVAMTAASLGHYCQMNLLEHPGPKAQVHLAGMDGKPLFFSQVRDAIAYQRMPEQSGVITAIYVSDMGKAESWDKPGADNWIAADAAVYVTGATVQGGMGAPELVPFSSREKAEAFAAGHGGQLVTLKDIPDEEILAPVEFATDADGNFLPPENATLN